MNKGKEFFFKHYKLFITIFLVVFLLILNIQLINRIDGQITFKVIMENINVTEIISTTTIIIGAVVAWVELYNSDKLNEANFIKDLNKQFIENKEMVEVEHSLEMYYNKTDRGEQEVSLNIDLRQDYNDRQKLINYLVYLEGLASIINHDIVHIEQINDLFGYRFFLAVNNPVVQMTELYPYSNYYQGIFKIYDKWKDFCKDKKSEDAMQIPLYDYQLRSNSYKITDNKDFKLNPRIRKANKNDDFLAIASILYETDQYIYPTAFGKDKEKAIVNMKKLISKETGLFSYNNILVATTKERNSPTSYIEVVRGALLYFDGKEENTWKLNDVLKSIPSSKGLKDASKKYFVKYSKPNEDYCDIVALSIDKRYHELKCGFLIMCTFSNMYCNKSIKLEVLKNNTSALNKYEQMLFRVVDEIDGYSIDDKKPRCIVMKRSPLCIVEHKK